MHWYYAQGDTRHGPYDDGQFEELVRLGMIRPETLVWNETMTDWVTFGQLRGGATPAEPGDAEAKVDPISTVPTAGDSSKTDRSTPFVFDGPSSEFFVLYLKNIALTLLTLGIYRFWAQVEIQRWIYQHTTFQGARFDYHATGKERFLAFLKAMVILGPVILLLVGLYHVMVENGFEEQGAFGLCFYGFFLSIFILRPLIVVGSMRFRLARTSWRGMRFRFSGTVGECYGMYIRDFFLTIFTFGIYGYWHHVNVVRFKAKDSDLGGEHFEFRGSALEYLGLTMGGIVLTYLTAGFFAPWMIAWIHRFHTDNLYFQGKPFKSHLTGLQVFGLILVSLLVIVCTLGIGLPWVLKRVVETLINSTEYTGVVDIEALKGSYDKGATAFVEGLGETGEAMEALGDIFGG